MHAGHPVKVVLDTSAVLAYPGVAVGELLAEIGDEGHDFGVPVICLALATAQTSPDRVQLLAKHARCVVLGVGADDVPHLATWIRLLGRVDLASAMTAARTHRAYVVSAEPDAYGDGLDLPVIGI